MRALTVAALFAAALPAAHAQAQTAPGDPEAITSRVFDALKRGSVDDAIAAVDTASPLLFRNKPEARDQITGQIEVALRGYGPVVRWERIGSEPLGTLMRRDTYLVQHRDMVLRWRFVYMKLDRGWTLANFNFDDQAPAWFDQAGPATPATPVVR